MILVIKCVIDVLYLAIAIVTMVVFIKRGFFESVFRYGRYIGAALISYFFAPKVGAFISEKFIYKGLFDLVSEKTEAFLRSVAGAFDVRDLIDNLPILVQRLTNVQDLEERYGAGAVDAELIADDFAASVATPVSQTLSNLIAYILVYLVALLALWLTFKLLNGIFKLPVLNATNRVLGGLFGFVAVAILLVIFTGILRFSIRVAGEESVFALGVNSSYLFGFFGK